MTKKIWAVWAGLPAPRWADWPNGARLCSFWAKTSAHSDFHPNRSRGSYRTYTEQSDPLVPTLLRHDEKRPNDANDEVIIHRKSSYSKKGYFVKSLNVLTHGASVIYLVELLIETGYF